jgi:uncharacterized cupredoxin-like copper-binding protein/Cu/Ag efflux protein CusF
MLLALFASSAALAHNGATHEGSSRSEAMRADAKPAEAKHGAPEQTPWGIAGQAATRTVTVEMFDNMRFDPEHLIVTQGETVRFVIHNRGRMLHEMVLGTSDTLAEHAKLMAKHPDMEHEEPYMAHVTAGTTGEIVWTFNRPGTFEYACLLPGHYEAGMRGRIDVSPPPIASVPVASVAAPVQVAQAGPSTEGVVRKIDRANGKVTLRHGAIENLGMPPMTMVFRATDPAMLDALEAGDQVRFEASLDGGVYTVTRIEQVR